MAYSLWMFDDFDDIPDGEEPGGPWPIAAIAYVTMVATGFVGAVSWPLWGPPLQRLLGH